MHLRLACLLLIPALAGQAAPQILASGENRTRLIELFTSEGCSSCPPAEAWLNGLRGDPGLWRDFVPVAFHVNYWDRLGWTDRLASREFTGRQHAYAEAWQANTVYTPGFVLDGREWPGRTRRQPPPRTADKPGVLTVTVGERRARVTFAPTAPGDYRVHAALLGAGIVSKVKSGENRGETLRHEFVALALVAHPLSAGQAEFALPDAPAAGQARLALAVWITRRDALEPLQATGGWLD